MGWFSGQSKAAKELERKRQQERDEENAKKADDVCEQLAYQKKVISVAGKGAFVSLDGLVVISRWRGCFISHFERRHKVDKPPNVLRVTVIRAKDLPAVDKKFVWEGAGLRGPFPLCLLRVIKKRAVKKKYLAPVAGTV